MIPTVDHARPSRATKIIFNQGYQMVRSRSTPEWLNVSALVRFFTASILALIVLVGLLAFRPTGASAATPTRQNITAIADSQVAQGCSRYLPNGCDPNLWWCAAFAEWVWRQAGVKQVPTTLVARSVGQWGVDHHVFKPRPSGQVGDPRPGDIVVFGSPAAATGGHVGIVYSVNANHTITTINGDYGRGPMPSDNRVVKETINPVTARSGGDSLPISGYVSPPGVSGAASTHNGGIDDVSGDGHADLLFTEGSSLQYLANRSGSNPGHVPFRGSSAQIARVGSDDLVAAGDLSGDGNADLLIYNRAGGTVSYLPNRASTNPGHVPFHGTATRVVSGLANNVSKIMAADVSGDGRADLEYLKSDGTLWYLPNNSARNPGHVPFRGTATRIVSGIPAGAVVTLGDLTGDGHADLLYVSKAALMLLPNRSGSNPGRVPFHGSAKAINATGFSAVVQLTAADVSGDGHADLLFTNADHKVYELDDRSSINPGHTYFHGNAVEVAHIGPTFTQLV